jgi:hypothetical protein
VDRRDVETAGSHEVGRDGFVARGYQHKRIPGDDSAMDLHKITERFPGRENVVHAVMEHGPAVAQVCSVKVRRLSTFLEYTDRDFF